MELEDLLTAENQLALSFLEQLPAPISRAVRERSRVLRFPKGDLILEGQVTGSYFFVLLGGAVRITTQGTDGRVLELSALRKGDCFGEMSLLTGAATSNRVEATEECLVLAVSRPDFHRLLSEFPLLSIVLYRMLSRRIRASNLRLTQLLTPGISGDLSLFGIADVIQSILTARMSGTLRINGSDQQACFGFREGQLCHASSGDLPGEDALLLVFQWKEGSFHFNGHEFPPEENISGDTMGLILDTLRRLDESSMVERGILAREG
jgi:CRP-like cAMP-binding protein